MNNMSFDFVRFHVRILLLEPQRTTRTKTEKDRLFALLLQSQDPTMVGFIGIPGVSLDPEGLHLIRGLFKFSEEQTLFHRCSP